MTLTKDSFNSDLKIYFGTYFLSLGPIPPFHPMMLLVLASSHFTVDSSRLGTSSSPKNFSQLLPLSVQRDSLPRPTEERTLHTRTRGVSTSSSLVGSSRQVFGSFRCLQLFVCYSARRNLNQQQNVHDCQNHQVHIQIKLWGRYDRYHRRNHGVRNGYRCLYQARGTLRNFNILCEKNVLKKC